MGENTFEFRGVNEFQEELRRIKNEFPDAEEKILNKGIRTLKDMSKEKTPYRTGDKRHIKDEYKVTKAKWNGDCMESSMTNTAPHFHLIERGHIQLDRKGNEVGFVPGQHMVKRSMEQMESEFPQTVEKMIGKLLRT
ncbi:HK97 gp10 family phage protein [Clostridium novyi]